MKLQLHRYSGSHESTLGLLFVNGQFESYTLEDEHRNTKVAGHTRIPKGTYQLQFRQVTSPLTRRYRDRYPWFSWHIELQAVPNFRHVYMHVGNTDADTQGCILVGDTANDNTLKQGFIGESRKAFEMLYKKLQPALNRREEVLLTIYDESDIAKK